MRKLLIISSYSVALLLMVLLVFCFSKMSKLDLSSDEQTFNSEVHPDTELEREFSFIYDDTFDNGTINMQNWVLNCPGGLASVSEGSLVLTTREGEPYPATDQVCELRYNVAMSGDFDTWITLKNFDYDSENTPLNVTAKILLADQKYPESDIFPPVNYAYILRQNFPGHEYQADASNVGSVGEFYYTHTNSSDGRIRLERVGDTLNFYFDDGLGEWSKLKSLKNKVFTGYIYIGLRTETEHPGAKIYLDDFHVHGIE